MSNPSLEHEGLLLLFRNRPSLAAECLRDLLGVEMPEFREIDVADTQVAQGRKHVYSDLIVTSLNKVARAALENVMATYGNYEIQSDLVKKWIRMEQDVKAKVLAEGKAEGKAEGLLAVLEARQVPIGEGARARILACKDLPELDRWIRKSVSVGSAAELFQD